MMPEADEVLNKAQTSEFKSWDQLNDARGR